MLSELEAIVNRYPVTTLKPVGFFLARSGVLTLAYEGFCSSLLSLKDEIEDSIPDVGIEHSGSKWPKTSLGALRAGTVLTIEEIEELHTLCLGWDTAIRKAECVLTVDKLFLVDYNCRSLERFRSQVPLKFGSEQTAESRFLPSWHLRDVDDVLAQFNVENLKEYSKEIQLTGNHEDHYRSQASGSTLVFRINSFELPFISGFIEDVEQLLPDHYAWFEPSSLHVTIRHLFTATKAHLQRTETL